METNLHIVTTAEHMLKPILPGRNLPGEMCVTFSRWGVSSIGTIQPGFHLAYLRLADIVERPIATAPSASKLLIKTRFGCWLIGTVNEENRAHYVAWAPLPKVSPEVEGRLREKRKPSFLH